MMAGLFDFITTPVSKAEDPLAAREKWLGLASIFQGMTMDPTAGQAGIQTQLQGIQQQRQKQAASKLAETQRNKTAQWLVAQGRNDLASGIMNGSLTGTQAFDLFKQQPKDARTAQIKNYEYWLGKNKTPEEAEALAKGGQTINVGAGDSAWEKKSAELMGKRLDELWGAGGAASNAKHNITILQQLGGAMDQGTAIPMAMRDLIPEGISAPIDAYRSTLYNVAKSLRQAGSGPMTDKDFDVLMKQAGSVAVDPKARGIAQAMLMRKANVDLQAAQIANQAMVGTITREDAFSKINELRNNPLLTDEERMYINQLGGTSTQIPTGDIDAANAALSAAMAEKAKRQSGQ